MIWSADGYPGWSADGYGDFSADGFFGGVLVSDSNFVLVLPARPFAVAFVPPLDECAQAARNFSVSYVPDWIVELHTPVRSLQWTPTP
jgi:hypothetical protein